ncbi:polyprenyl synthetase family protein [Streptomyces sp. NPDC056632]|uniref:polyprenyl synthetase family protein n=1 Tax=Streptomyces sp. NPDC056632 TaxID=3345884 RepID=UPI0036A27532
MQTPQSPVSSGTLARVDAILDAFLTDKAGRAAGQRLPGEISGTLRDFLFSGGKRVRPLLCVAGWHATAGDTDTPDPVLRAAASLELFHAFALIHDDVMDGSSTRRGRPTVHRAFTMRHADARTPATAARLGAGAAVLIGDMALAWSDELLHTSGLAQDQLTAALRVIDTMRTELMYGQYLDLLTTGRPDANSERPLWIARHKTAKYTVERPLHLGAALAAAGPDIQEAMSAYALPIGEAFQLRDDILGVYGAPGQTGKGRLDDLRDGKNTALVAHAYHSADAAQRRVLDSLVGDPALDDDGAARIRDVLEATGARTRVEDMIRTRHERACRILDQAPFHPAAVPSLRRLADAVAWRTS